MKALLLLSIGAVFANGILQRKEYNLQRKRREFVAKRRSKQISMDSRKLENDVLTGMIPQEKFPDGYNFRKVVWNFIRLIFKTSLQNLMRSCAQFAARR